MRKVLCAVLFLSLIAGASFAQDGARRMREHENPVYPDLARQMNVPPVVRLQVTILPSGSVREVKILGGHPLLADAAVKAVQTWKWDPGREETKTLIITFKQ